MYWVNESFFNGTYFLRKSTEILDFQFRSVFRDRKELYSSPRPSDSANNDGYGGEVIPEDVRDLLDFIAETIIRNNGKRQDGTY